MVFDASTLILFAKISLLTQVAERYRLNITSEVQRESTRLDRTDARLIARFIDAGQIEVHDVASASGEIAELKRDFTIAEGEASSIWLAADLGVPVATDDGRTIKAAKVLGLKFATAIHLLLESHRAGEVSTAIALAKLDKLGRVGRYSRQLLDHAVARLRRGEEGPWLS